MRVRTLALTTVAVLVFAACGNDSKDSPQDAVGDTSTTLDEHSAEHEETGDHDEHADDMDHDAEDMDHDAEDMDHDAEDMDHDAEDMDHEQETARPAQPLPLLPDGTLDPDGVDLSGIEGVTAGQQAYAEALLVDTITTLPKWSDYDKAIADGFLSIGDGPTGEEHVIHWDWIDDDRWLDPEQPESLVYRVERDANGVETKTLEAAMFLLPKKFNLDNAPTDGGALMQYHIHDDLCFTDFPQPRVVGLRSHGGECPEGQIEFNPNIMVHVWIRQNDCGPFAALKGIGGGQIKAGEEVSCLHEHGSASL